LKRKGKRLWWPECIEGHGKPLWEVHSERGEGGQGLDKERGKDSNAHENEAAACETNLGKKGGDYRKKIFLRRS